MSEERLVQALSAELDAARSGARFEADRADRAEARTRELARELERVQQQLRAALAGPSGAQISSGELTQRLKLALDSNHRLEQARGKQEREAVELAEHLKRCREVARRWEQRARALEGQLKLLG